jgi:hypothetical protein
VSHTNQPEGSIGDDDRKLAACLESDNDGNETAGHHVFWRSSNGLYESRGHGSRDHVMVDIFVK